MKYFSIFLLLFLYSNLQGQDFLDAVKITESLPIDERRAYFEKYLNTKSEIPIIEDDSEVYFVTKVSNARPYLKADFNGFLNPRYIKDKSIGLMEEIDGTNWYYFQKSLSQNAVINYKYEYEGAESIDSLNQNSRISFGEEISYVRMSKAGDIIKPTPKGKSGELVTLEITSEIQNHVRTIHVYTPHNYATEESLPSIYFHDGSFFTGEMKVPEILDYLIANEFIEPVVAVFDNPVIRGKEYRGDTSYINYVKDELVPYISGNYKVSQAKKDRSIIGFSRGGMSAFYLAYRTALFSKLGALSPAISPTEVSTFMEQFIEPVNRPEQVFITGARYDHLWFNDALKLQEEVKGQDIQLSYIEAEEGHNISCWQTQIDDILIAFAGRSN